MEEEKESVDKKISKDKAPRTQYNFVWKTTMEDSELPFVSYSYQKPELEKKQLKDYEDIEDFTGNIITTDISKLESKDVISKGSK